MEQGPCSGEPSDRGWFHLQAPLDPDPEPRWAVSTAAACLRVLQGGRRGSSLANLSQRWLKDFAEISTQGGGGGTGPGTVLISSCFRQIGCS